MGRPKGSTNKSSSKTSKSASTAKKQTALTFQNKITKPTPASLLGKPTNKSDPSAAATKKAALLEDSLSKPPTDVSFPAPESAESPVLEPNEAVKGNEVEGQKEKEKELAIRQPKAPVVDELEETARKTSDAQVRRYWKGVDDLRMAPRVHQQGLTVNDKILRHFDMSSQFGPSIGIARHNRWKRAQKLGLNPPIEVLAVLLKGEAAGQKKGLLRSHVDEMINARVGVVD